MNSTNRGESDNCMCSGMYYSLGETAVKAEPNYQAQQKTAKEINSFKELNRVLLGPLYSV